MTTLDAVREAYPDLGMALYALDPRGPVTLEILTDTGDLFTFHGSTEAEVLGRAFPAPPEPEQEPEAAIDDIFG